MGSNCFTWSLQNLSNSTRTWLSELDAVLGRFLRLPTLAPVSPSEREVSRGMKLNGTAQQSTTLKIEYLLPIQSWGEGMPASATIKTKGLPPLCNQTDDWPFKYLVVPWRNKTWEKGEETCNSYLKTNTVFRDLTAGSWERVSHRQHLKMLNWLLQWAVRLGREYHPT